MGIINMHGGNIKGTGGVNIAIEKSGETDEN